MMGARMAMAARMSVRACASTSRADLSWPAGSCWLPAHHPLVGLTLPPQKHRQEQKHQHFQRTKKGQPLMRYRIEKMLDELRAGQ
jgi:hypothetical protein